MPNIKMSNKNYRVGLVYFHYYTIQLHHAMSDKHIKTNCNIILCMLVKQLQEKIFVLFYVY